MMIGFVGNMGQGKTLCMSVLAKYMYLKMKKENPELELYANYHLAGAKRYSSVRQMWDINNAIVLHDEIHSDMDSRAWKKNIDITLWLAQTRKKNILYMWTSQGFDKVELRVRKATDILVLVEKLGKGTHKLQFIDLYSKKMGKITVLRGMDTFFDIYDSYEVIKPLKN